MTTNVETVEIIKNDTVEIIELQRAEVVEIFQGIINMGGGGGGAGFVAVGEVPSGAINGVNQDYTTAANFTTLFVYLNGIRMRVSSDYTVTGANAFHFLYPPMTGDALTVDYI